HGRSRATDASIGTAPTAPSSASSATLHQRSRELCGRGRGDNSGAAAPSAPTSGPFCSSRRRHTRSLRDWSSDVCSSDLRSSAWAIGGMVLLLAVCGWIVGGPEGARRAVNNGVPRGNGFAVTGETMYRWFGARLLRHAEMPGLFHILTDVCRRARLSRLPDLYYLAAPQSMNAYALGGPDGAAIVLTEGLLRGMTPGEVAG